MNVRKYIVLIVFFLFYFQNHTLSNEEKTNLENFFSEKSIEYIQKEIQVFKKYQFSEPHWLEVDRLKLKLISECSVDENKNTSN